MAARGKRTAGRGRAARRAGGKSPAATPLPPGRAARRAFVRAGIAILAAVVLLITLLRFVNPPLTPYMAWEWWRLGRIEHSWVPLARISPDLARAVVAAEDANFCRHWGFDMSALRRAIAEGGRRGASTITQQTVKNLFLWQGRSWPRKAIEALLTPLVELLWPKRRILEVYLNVIETGPGLFGVEAASRRYWGVPAARLDLAQAARLAVILPDPRNRDPRRLPPALERRARVVAEGARTIAADGRDACFGG